MKVLKGEEVAKERNSSGRRAQETGAGRAEELHVLVASRWRPMELGDGGDDGERLGTARRGRRATSLVMAGGELVATEKVHAKPAEITFRHAAVTTRDVTATTDTRLT